MNSLTVGRVIVVCAACFGILLLARESGPRNAPPPWPTEVQSRVLASSPRQIEISIQLPKPQVVQTAARASGDRIELTGMTDYVALDDAELPVIRQLIAIPDCDRVDLQVEVSGVERTGAVTVRSPAAPTNSGEIALPERSPPSQGWARVVDIQHARGQALARVELYPARYNRGKREVSHPREIRLRLKPVNPRGPVVVDAGPLQSALSAVVPNLKEFGAGSSIGGSGQRTMRAAGEVCWCDTGDDDWLDAADYVNTYCAADYLIIVADELLADAADSSHVEQLATKRAEFNGFNVAVVRMGQIDSTPDNTTTPDLIRNLVKRIYDYGVAAHMGDERLGFLLLLGDAVNPDGDIILPPHYLEPGNYIDQDRNGSDAYFVLLDGSGDVVPDILVGRLTVDADEDDWELENVVSKIVDYEPISASATWTNDVLLMSGGDDGFFTFDGAGLSGFQNYFDAIESVAPTSVEFVEMHRLTTGAGATEDSLFSKAVCDEIANGYSVVGLFDHANPVNFRYSFFPIHYDTLNNNAAPPLILSFGSHSGFFDRLSTGWCCPEPSYGGVPCKVPVTAIDPCDALVERLLVQPAGAIGVIAYARTHQATTIQRVFANAFRSLFQHKQGQIGSLVVATKLLSADAVTTAALNLLGDPALSIHYQFDSVSQDSIDLAVSGLDMAFPSSYHDYASTSSQSLTVVVANKWKDAAATVPVEIWRGVPDAVGASLLNSFTIASLAGHSDTTWTGSIGSFSVGDHDVYVTVDPDGTLDDPVPANNVSYRTLHVRDYVPGFPRACAGCFGNRLDLLDSMLGSPKELEIAAGGSLFGADGSALGGGGTGPGGNLFRSDKRQFVSKGNLVIDGNQQMVVTEAGGVWQNYLWVSGTVSDVNREVIALDHGRPDSMLVAVHVGQGTDRKIKLYTVAGALQWSCTIGNASGGTSSLYSFAMAAGDVTGDGMSDIVYAIVPTVGPGADSLGVIDGKTGERLWTIPTSDEVWSPVRVRLVDVENDGSLDILVNTRVAGSPVEDRIQCYDASGSLLWQVAAGEADAFSQAPTFVPADVGPDGVKEVVFAHEQRLGIITASGGSASVGAYTDLTGYRTFHCTPLAVDIDGDDILEFVLFSVLQEHNLNEYSLEMRVYDDDLALIGSTLTFRWVNQVTAPITSAVGDIDGDGVHELVFVTPDGALHAVQVGTSAGRTDWASADGDPLHGNLFEQVLGGGYSEHVAIHGRARVLSDAVFSDGVTITAPADVQVGALDSLFVEESLAVLGTEDDSVRVRIDALESPGSRWGALVYRNAIERGDVRHMVVTDATVAFDHESPLQMSGSRILGPDVGMVSMDSLWVADCTIEAGITGMYLEQAYGVVAGTTIGGAQFGVVAHSGTSLALSGSVIEGASLYGLICYDSSTVDVSGTSFDGNDIGLKLPTEPGTWVKADVRDCMFTNNVDGIWIAGTGDAIISINGCVIDNSTTSGVFVDTPGAVTIRRCTITNGTNGVYAYGSNPKVGPRNAIQYNTVGVACEQYAGAVVESCLVTENIYGVTVRTGSNPDLGHVSGGGSSGYNIFIPTTSYYVHNKTSNTVSGQRNYWPASPPTVCLPNPTKIYGPVDAEPALCSPPEMLLLVSEWKLDAETSEPAPARIELAQNFPNPFNPATTIAYSVPTPGARVEIALYDVAGRRVAELLNAHKVPGRYQISWDGRNRRGEPVASGVYFLRMRAGTFVETRKLHLIR